MQRQPNEVVKHGLAAAHMPERADWTIDQGWARYRIDDFQETYS